MCVTICRRWMSRRRWMRWPKRSRLRFRSRRSTESRRMVIETCQEVVYISGWLGTNQWPVIKTTAAQIYERYPQGIVIDLSGVQWISEEGERTLIAAMDDIESQDLPFALVNLSSSVQTTLTTSV